MLRKLFSHTAIYGLAPQITKLASFFTLPIITQDLTSLDYGVSGVMAAYTSSISVLAALGLRLVLVNSFFKSPSQFKWAWRQIYGFLTIWNFVYTGMLAVLIYFIVPKEALENRWTILLLNIGPLVFFGQTSTICSTYYQLEQKPLQIALRSIICGLLAIGLNLIFISYYKMGYMGWFWSSFIVGILSNLSYYYPLNIKLKFTPIFNFKWRFIKNSLKISLPAVPHYYSGYLLNSSDKMVMDFLKVSTGNIGKYNVAYTVGNIMNSLGTASGLAVGPMLNRMYKAGKDESAKNLISVLQLSFFIITFCLSLWMKEIFQFLIRNDELAGMYYLGIIIVMSYNYRPMYFGANAKLMFNEKTNVLWKVTLVAGLLNVALNLIFIPIFGFQTAAYTTFVSLMYMGYAGFYFKVFKEVNFADYCPFCWLILTVILTILAYFAVEFAVEIKFVISILILISSVYIIWKINCLIEVVK